MPGIWREWGLKEGLSPWSSILGTHHTVFRLGGGGGGLGRKVSSLQREEMGVGGVGRKVEEYGEEGGGRG